MIAPRATALLLGLVGLLAATSGAAQAETLFAPLDDAGLRRSPALPRVRALALRAGALAQLRTKNVAQVTDFPLGIESNVSLELERFEPRGPNARADVVGADGAHSVPLPDDLYFRGRVVGSPQSRVLLVAAADHVRGWIGANGTIYRVGIDADRIHRSYALRDVPPGATQDPGDFCGQKGQPALSPAGLGGPRAAGPTPPTEGFSPGLIAQVAIETDEELRAKFATDADTLAYVIDLVAAASTIYEADVDIQLVASYVRIWSDTDPWSATSTSGSLDEVKDYWSDGGNEMNAIAGPRDVVHFVSGKPVHGGIAYLDVLCSASYGYAVSQVYGTFDVMDPSSTWDVVVFSHETGHLFGSPHTHCYTPPLDHCYNQQAGCYSGPAQPSTGTIMSYCHLSGGLAAIQLTLGTTVDNLIRSHADASSCVLAVTCGDGVLSPGEECDDGNTAAGDCCSPTCSFELAGSPCDDQNPCSGSDVCQGDGTCDGTPVADGSPCDDGSRCTTDACGAGICVGTPTPAASCRGPVTSQGAALRVTNKTGLNSDSLNWKWGHGAATALADFGDPTATTDFELCVYADGGAWLTARVPAGGLCAGRSCWSASGSGFKYKDIDRTPDGISSATLGAGLDGKARLAVKGKGADLGLPNLASLTLPVTVQWRSATECWGATFATPTTSTAERFTAKSP